MNTRVTGANGFRGSWRVRALTARGQQVACPLRSGSDVSSPRGQRYESVAGDVTDAASRENLLVFKRVARGPRLALGGGPGR